MRKTLIHCLPNYPPRYFSINHLLSSYTTVPPHSITWEYLAASVMQLLSILSKLWQFRDKQILCQSRCSILWTFLPFLSVSCLIYLSNSTFLYFFGQLDIHTRYTQPTSPSIYPKWQLTTCTWYNPLFYPTFIPTHIPSHELSPPITSTPTPLDQPIIPLAPPRQPTCLKHPPPWHADYHMSNHINHLTLMPRSASGRSVGNAFLYEPNHYSCKSNECFGNRFFITLKLKFEPLDQQNITSYFHQKQNKSFYHFWKHAYRNHLNFFRTSLLWINVEMIFVSVIALKFQNLCMKTTLCQTFYHIVLFPKKTQFEHLGGMIKLGGNPKTYNKIGFMILFLRKQNVG